MKTLTKILSVTALIVLCVCLFTLTAFAANTYHPPEAATCTTTGMKEYYDNGDGKYYSDPACQTEVPYSTLVINIDTTAAGHNVEAVAKQDASCYAAGHEAYWKCTRCGKMWSAATCQETEVITAPVAIPKEPQHKAASETVFVAEVPATCGKAGNVKYWRCKWCGEPILSATADSTASTVEVPPTGVHTWGPWLPDEAATEVKGGTEVRVCSGCGEKEYRSTEPTGLKPNPNTADNQLWSVIAERDTWFRGEETLLFRSDLIKWLNDHGHGTNRVGLRIGTDRSLYDGTYYTFDFWSWDQYVEFGDKMLNGLEEGTYYLWIYDREDPDVHTNSVPFYVVDVPTLEPYSTDKHVVNSSKSLRFVASEEIDPNSVKVGSKKLYDSNDYFVSNDRKNITLSPDFLNARQTGTYTISALTKDGRTIKTNFYILSTAQASSSPRTGDESQIGLWAAFLLLSGAAIVVMVPKLRKHGAK